MFVRENFCYPKHYLKPEIPLPELQAHAPERSNPGPVVNLCNEASNMTMNFNYQF